MNEEKIVNNYYQSNIKTSRGEDSVYAMRYASQQMLINKLEHNWNELKKWLEERYLRVDSGTDFEIALHMTLNKMQEIEGGNNE